MKQLFFIISFSLCAIFAQAQFRLAVNGTPSWTNLGGGLYSATMTFHADLTGNSYAVAGIVDTMRLFTSREQVFEVDSVWGKTFSQATLRVEYVSGVNSAPVGQGMVYAPNPNGFVPDLPFGSTGATAQLNAAVDTWNARQISTSIADSTRLEQDSILVYYQGGVEIGRDTISIVGIGADGDKGDITNEDSLSVIVSAVNVTTQTSSPGYTARDGAEAFYSVTGDTLFQIGGWPSLSDNQQWYSIDDGQTWTQAANAAWTDSHAFGFIRKGNTFYKIGSDGSVNPTYNDEVWKSTDGLNWTLVTDAAQWGTRILQGTALRNDTMFVFGGQIGTCSIIAYKDVWYSVDGITWDTLCGNCLPELGGHLWRNVAVHDGYFWIVGGEYYDGCLGRVRHKKVYRSADGITWTLMGTLPISTGADTGITYNRTFSWNGALWTYAGVYIDGSAIQTRNLLYTVDGITWVDVTNASLPATHAAAIAIKNENTFIITSGWLFNTVYRVDARRRLMKYDNNRTLISTDYLIPNNDFFGTNGQTIRHNGSRYVANSFLYNSGAAIGINTTSPTQMLEVSSGDAVIHGVRVGRGTGSNQFNTAIGFQAINAGTTGNENTGVGYRANRVVTTGSRNTAVGSAALYSNVTGSSNTAIGTSALENYTASDNTAVGRRSLWKNTTAPKNTAVGTEALQATTTGAGSNTAVGYQAMYSTTIAGNNTAIGVEALYSNTTGGSNTAVGFRALYNNTTAIGNTAIGINALQANTTGANNIAIGFNALQANTTGGNNIAIGTNALIANTTGNNNTSFGYASGSVNSTGSNNTAFGYNAYLNGNGTGNTLVGSGAGGGLTSGQNNTIIGYQLVGSGVTTGSHNTLIGANITGLTSAINNNIVIADGQGNQRIRVDSVGRMGINNTTPARTLHVAGELRVTDLTTDTPTRIVGADADGDLGAITLGSGLNLSGGTLTATGGVAEDSLVVGHVPYVSAANTIQTDPAGDADAMAYDNSLNILTVKRIKLKGGSGTNTELLGRNTSDYNVNGITVGANLTLSSNILSVKDTVYINLIAAKPGVAVTQTAGHDYYDATFLVPNYLDGFNLARVDYAMTNSTATTGSWTVGIRLMSTTNTSVTSNGCAATFNAGDVRASSSGGLTVSKNQWLYIETNTAIAGTLDGTNEGLLATLMFVK